MVWRCCCEWYKVWRGATSTRYENAGKPNGARPETAMALDQEGEGNLRGAPSPNKTRVPEPHTALEATSALLEREVAPAPCV